MNESREYKDQRLSRVYREGAWPEPSRQIDQAILAASRRAAREQPFVKRWAPSFAIAATVVLTSALVLKVVREQPEAVSPTLPEKVAAPGAQQAPLAAEAKTAETKAAPAQAPQTATTPSGFSQTMDAGEAERLDRLQRDLALRRSAPPNESPAPAPNFVPAEKPAVALKKEAPEANRAGDALLQRRPDIQTLRARESPPPPREQRPATAPVSVFGAPPPAALAPTPTPASPPAPAAATAPAAAATSGAVASALSAAPKAAERSPQAWIEDIRKLMAAGKSEEAGGELAEFKKRYPDYTLPEDLR